MASLTMTTVLPTSHRKTQTQTLAPPTRRRTHSPPAPPQAAAPTTVASASAFARFDAALQDSDQTITGGAFVSARGLYAPTRDRSAWTRVAGRASPAAAGRSSFFPDSTDDDDSRAAIGPTARVHDQPHGRMQQQRKRPVTAQAVVSASAFPVLHMGDILFPMTRSVLWDRRVLAGPCIASVEDALPRVRICSSVLQQLHALQRARSDAVSQSDIQSQWSARLLGYMIGERSDADGEGRLVLTRVEKDKSSTADQTRRLWSVPVYDGKPQYDEDAVRIRDAMIVASQATCDAAGAGNATKSATLIESSQAIISVPLLGSPAELCVQLEAFVPRARFQFELIRNLPLLMTPLAASLARCEFGATLRSGLLTLDRARKAVPLLESDPLAVHRPIVGIWVYGLTLEAPSTSMPNALADRLSVHHPYLLQSCVRFLRSRIVMERVFVAEDTFLVAAYPGLQIPGSPLPRFCECTLLKETIARSNQGSIAWELATATARCLAGVSSFHDNVDMQFTMAMPIQNPADTHSRAASASASMQDVDGGTANASSAAGELKAKLWSFERPTGAVTVGLSIDGAEPLSNMSDSMKAQAHSCELPSSSRVISPGPSSNILSVNEADDESSRSCCRSQEHLARQQQQMLQDYQRQLRELQEQIAQLQRVLTATQAENVRLLAAGIMSSGGSEDGKMQASDLFGPQTPTVSVAAANPAEFRRIDVVTDPHVREPIVTQTDGCGLVHQSGYGANDESGVSSLQLSSISHRSHESDLSSISSSLVGEHPKISVTDNATAAMPQDVKEVDVGDTEPLDVGNRGSVLLCLESDSPPDEGDRVSDAEERANTCLHGRGRSVDCERDEFEVDADADKVAQLMAERLHVPDTPNREEIVKSGALATFGFSDGGSFCIPKIKYVVEPIVSDSEDEDEIRRIELKYRRHHLVR